MVGASGRSVLLMLVLLLHMRLVSVAVVGAFGVGVVVIVVVTVVAVVDVHELLVVVEAMAMVARRQLSRRISLPPFVFVHAADDAVVAAAATAVLGHRALIKKRVARARHKRRQRLSWPRWLQLATVVARVRYPAHILTGAAAVSPFVQLSVCLSK